MGVDMRNKTKNLLKRILPLSMRRGIGSLRYRIMTMIDGKGRHSGWKSILHDDIFLVSYPRSGNTWLRNIMTNLRFPDAKWDLRSMAVAFPEIHSDIDPELVPRPRWIKSHDAYDGNYPKVIYLVRDGRDVAVSYYHWSGGNEFQSFEAFLEETVLASSSNEFGGFESWHNHVNGWLDHQGGHMLVVKYESLRSDAVTEVQRICAFVGIERTTDQINRALIESSFEKQQKDFANYKPFKNRSVGVKGGKNKWKEYFSDELLEKYWHVAGGAMERAGYEKISSSPGAATHSEIEDRT